MLKVARVKPTMLHQEDCWVAELFCGDAALILNNYIEGVTLQELGNCIEGWRVSTQKENQDYDHRIELTPIYRQAQLGCLSFNLEPEHWKEAIIEDKWCIQPGDVVINKLPPLRASIATSKLPRHPVDGNCILIRGIKKPLNTWTAICLNQKFYKAYLIERQGKSFFARVGLKGLSQLNIPLPPMNEALSLHQKIWDWNEQVLENDESRIRLIEKVNSYIFQELEDAEVNIDDYPLCPGKYFPASVIADSLAPSHVRISYQLSNLKNKLGWIELEKLLNKNTSRARLSDVPKIGFYLRLKDIDRDLTLSIPNAESDLQLRLRVFRQPLTQEEVLISTLVTNPRVVFVDEPPSENIYITDHWERLRFFETPGAWALVLNTKVIRTQLKEMAIGAILQFTRPENISRLVVPNIPLKVREHWENELLTHHKRHRELQQKRKLIDHEAKALFNRVHRIY